MSVLFINNSKQVVDTAAFKTPNKNRVNPPNKFVEEETNK